MRYLDTRKDERERELSIKATPMSLLLPNSRGKTHLISLMDTPGHVNFGDEATAAMRLSDVCVLVVDAAEGVVVQTKKLIQQAVEDQLDILLVLNKIDRLALELRLPPVDAYTKLQLVVFEVNEHIRTCSQLLGVPAQRMEPAKDNVAFASGENFIFFTLSSWCRIYRQLFQDPDPVEKLVDQTDFDSPFAEMSRYLWGDLYYDPAVGTISKTAPSADTPRSFVSLVLEPLWKIFAHVVAEERPTLEPFLQELGVFLKASDFALAPRRLLKVVGYNLFQSASEALVDMLTFHGKSPKSAGPNKVQRLYCGDQDSTPAADMANVDSKGVLVVHTAKNYHRPGFPTRFDVFGRVMSGTLGKGSRVMVLGEQYSLDDDEDCVVREVEALWILNGRYRVEVSHVPAGNWALIAGVEAGATKTSTLTDAAKGRQLEVAIYKPLRFASPAVVKVACEPLNPSELPKMLAALSCVDRAYPSVNIKVEESGEHVIVGTGELYLDCVLHDLRRVYGDVEIKVADPVVSFQETVLEQSSQKCIATSPNGMSVLSMIAEPLELAVAKDIEAGVLSFAKDKRGASKTLHSKHDWDLLSARRVWAFGPENHAIEGPNVFLDDTLPDETDRPRLLSTKDMLVSGFQWAAREGPLIEQEMRNTKIRLLHADLADNPIHRSGGQIVPTARRCVYSAFLTGCPRIMEPVMLAEVLCPADCVQAIYNVAARRRGHVASDQPRPGTPLFVVQAYIPAIESFGFETDIRTHTSGQAMVLTIFDHWDLVPGDPLDQTIVLRPLEPSPAPHLAREFLLKTRRRKGLAADVTVGKFFD